MSSTPKQSDAAADRASRRVIAWALIVLLVALFIYEIRSVLLPFVVGMLTAYFLDPAADRLEARGLKRWLATALITGLFFITLIVAGVLIIPLIVHQCADLLAALPSLIDDLQARYGSEIERWFSYLGPDQAQALQSAGSNIAGSLLRFTGDVITGMFASGFALINVLSLLLITPLVAFYLLRDWDVFTARVDRLLPRKHAKTIHEQLAAIDATLAGFIRGQLNVCLLLGIYYALLLSLVGLNFGLVIGLATGLLTILPYVGFGFSLITALGIGMLQFGFTLPLLLVGAVYAGGQVLESFFLTPKLVGSSVGLHPLWIIFGMLSGGALLGIVGVLIAVPATAIIGVLIRFAADRYLDSALYKGR